MIAPVSHNVDDGTSEMHNDNNAMEVMPDVHDRHDRYYPSETDDDDLNEQDFQPDTPEDMNLDLDDGNIEEEALLPSMFNDVSFMYETIRSRIPPDSMKPRGRKNPKGHLNWTAIALTQLLLLVNKHGGGKAMFDDILKHIFGGTKAHPTVFLHNEGMPIWTRDAVLEALQDEFDSLDLEFEKNNVQLNDGRTVTIPVVDFGAQARDVLDNPFTLANVADGIDKETFRPIALAEQHENDPNAVIGENTRDFYTREQ
jgi:hypothetical protein